MPNLYEDHFSTFWLQTRILNLLINASINNIHLTKDQFSHNLAVFDENDAISSTPAVDIIGRDLCEDDMDNDDVVSVLVISLYRVWIDWPSL